MLRINRNTQNLKAELNAYGCLIHVDFAENYVGKMYKEISKMHFDASTQQVSIHTGVQSSVHIHLPLSVIHYSMVQLLSGNTFSCLHRDQFRQKQISICSGSI